MRRIITGLIMAAAAISLIVWGHPDVIAAALILVASMATWELHAMVAPDRLGERLFGVVSMAWGLVCLHMAWAVPFQVTLGVVACVPPLLVLARPDPLDQAFRRMAALWSAYIYLGVPFGLGLALTSHPLLILMLCVVVFAGDTGAFFAGRALGRHKLYEKISPKKTIEGAIGGLVASVAGALALTAIPELQLSMPTVIVLALAGGILGIVGDLVESALKRSCGVKDSGTILPGHGGILDRLDAFIFAMPLFAIVAANT